MNDTLIGERVKALRLQKSMTQEALVALLGVTTRQTVSQIENGTRRVTVPELLKLAEHFETSMERLTNPFMLIGNNAFSWRQSQVPQGTLDAFEEKAGEWIGAYRELAGRDTSLRARLLHNTKLTYRSSFEDAIAVGEALADQLELGDRPAFRLANVMEQKLGILVMMVDAANGISGAACHLPQLNAVLINRGETPARRHSDLAHEFFHILTWNEMKPDHVESSEQTWDAPMAGRSHKLNRNQRIEQLADNFASGLLMPSRLLDKLGTPKGDEAQWFAEAARHLGISVRALKWRLVNSKRYPEAKGFRTAEAQSAGRVAGDLEAQSPPLFSKKFMTMIAGAIESGDLSGRRAATLLGMDREAVGDLCDAHQVKRPVELGGSELPLD